MSPLEQIVVLIIIIITIIIIIIIITVLLIKDKVKGNAVGNYRPITCLPIMWKVLTGIIAEDLYQHLHQSSLLPDEQKGCRKESRGKPT